MSAKYVPSVYKFLCQGRNLAQSCQDKQKCLSFAPLELCFIFDFVKMASVRELAIETKTAQCSYMSGLRYSNLKPSCCLSKALSVFGEVGWNKNQFSSRFIRIIGQA